MASLRGSGMDGLTTLEHGWIELAEEFAVQRFDGGAEVFFRHHETDIEQRAALRNHADVDAFERIEDAARHARRIPDVFADQADDDLIAFDFGFGELAQLGEHFVEVRRIVDGERDADLGGGHHIDGRFEAVEDFEDAAQKAVRHQHARGMNVDDGDLALTGDRFDGVFAVNALGHDARAGNLRAARIQDQHRDAFLDGRQHGGRMEHFGAEIGQFGGFGEGDGLDAMAAGEDGGIGRQHAVHVGPDLDLLGADAGSHDGRGEIGTAAAEGGGDAVLAGGDEAAHHDDASGGNRRHNGGKARVGLWEQRRGLRVALIGDDKVARIQVPGFHARMAKGLSDNVTRQAFAITRDSVNGARGKFPEYG